jgi:hypothetical protein
MDKKFWLAQKVRLQNQFIPLSWVLDCITEQDPLALGYLVIGYLLGVQRRRVKYILAAAGCWTRLALAGEADWEQNRPPTLKYRTK